MHGEVDARRSYRSLDISSRDCALMFPLELPLLPSMPPGRDRVLSINLKPGHDVSASKGSFCFTDEKKVWLKCIYNAMPYHEHMDADIIRLAEAIVAGYHRCVGLSIVSAMTPLEGRLMILGHRWTGDYSSL